MKRSHILEQTYSFQQLCLNMCDLFVITRLQRVKSVGNKYKQTLNAKTLERAGWHKFYASCEIYTYRFLNDFSILYSKKSRKSKPLLIRKCMAVLVSLNLCSLMTKSLRKFKFLDRTMFKVFSFLFEILMLDKKNDRSCWQDHFYKL